MKIFFMAILMALISQVSFAQSLELNGRSPAYLFKIEGSKEVIYVDSPIPMTYEFNFYKGTPGKMEQIEVLDVRRMRDGGTTYVTTTDGKLYSPSFFKKDEAATWSDGSGTYNLMKLPINEKTLRALGIK